MKLLQRREPQPQRTKQPSRGGRAVAPESRWRRILRETRSELKKVVWPTREQTIRLTGIVVAVSVAVGLFLGGVDLLFEQVFQILLGGL